MVGTDAIQPDERVIAGMRRLGVAMEAAQIKNYIVNNRHNHITAYYYLLKKKAERNPALLQQDQRQLDKEDRRSSSPLIYKPEQKKEFYVPIKRPIPENRDNTKVNDSFNASTIVSSLVEANKNKIISNMSNTTKGVKKIDTFDKTEEFKLFPKPKTNSIYQSPVTTTTPLSISINPLTGNQKVASLTTRSEV